MEIEYTLIRKRIKNIYIGIKDGKVIVRAPLRISEDKIKEIISQKEAWIIGKLSSLKENRLPDLKNKSYIYILGKKVNIEYIHKDVKKATILLEESKCSIILPSNVILDDSVYLKLEKSLDKMLKQIIIDKVNICMEKYIKLTGLKPKSIEVKKFKSIWGNCSSQKNIKINQNLVHYSINEIEYVCLHELTHLKYMNHQKEFWNYIEKYMPDYKERRKALK